MIKKILTLFVCLIFVLPAYAVLNEKNTARTISVLRYELLMTWQEKNERDLRHEKFSQMEEVQHRRMVSTIKWINELTLILYSQERDCTLDQTYAMEGVIREYEKFNNRRRPKYTSIETIDSEIERYQRLIETLRLLPPKLDIIEDVPDTLRNDPNRFDVEVEDISFLLDSILTSSKTTPVIELPSEDKENPDDGKNLFIKLATYGRNSKKEAADTSNADSFVLTPEAQEDRDSCIAYARYIIRSYTKQKEKIEQDENYFAEMHARLLQSYEYSKSRYQEIQKYIFISGQENYLNIIANFRKYTLDALDDLAQKYGSGGNMPDSDELQTSQWRGFVLAGTLIYGLLHIMFIFLIVYLVCCVILKKVKPFNTEWFRQTKPVVLLLAVAVIYLILISVSCFFPMSNFMLVAVAIALTYLWFLIALVLSLLVGLKEGDVRGGLMGFVPVLVLGLLVMFIRAMFLPDRMINLLLTPVLLFFLIWQIHAARKFKTRCKGYRTINILLNITTAVFVWAFISAAEGYSLFSMMFIMWWIFQVATFTTLTSIAHIMEYYEKKHLSKKKEKYAAAHKMVSRDEPGDFIHVTWLFDFVYKAVLPIAGILSILGCIWLGSSVFNLSETCRSIFHETFFDFTNTDGNPILQVSLFKLATVCVCFFIFRYLNYLIRSLYRINKFEKIFETSGNDFVRKNDVNLTLAYNVIGIIIWGLFLVYSIVILKIPIGAISIVAAGLATGIGLALKDVLNNFIYGIQLMSGRLRVGDMLECDGIRGTVEKISYQSTEIQTLNGAVISFTNSALFNKNFQNLTKNSPYEFLAIAVSIPYGEEVEKVRSLISESMKEFSSKRDKYGRFLIDQKKGVSVILKEFGDSSVNLDIQQSVLVESKSSYSASVREHIYKLFNEHGIEMPCPQQEVSILNFPKK